MEALWNSPACLNSSSHLYNDRWNAATEKIPRAEKKSHLPGELRNRTKPVARVLSCRSALAKQQKFGYPR